VLTDQGRKDAEEDVGEGVQQHDQDTGPEQPVTRRRCLNEDLWVLERQVDDREERKLSGSGLRDSLAGSDKRGSDW
jgi:hypothetical protein